MLEKYKVSRELGRQPPKEEEPLPEEEIESLLDIADTKVEGLEGDHFWLNGYVGQAKNCVVVKSDLPKQMKEIEEVCRARIVGLTILEDGTIMTYMEDLNNE